MSPPALVMARSPFSTAAFAQLVRRLRHTNARYDQIAHQFRCRVRPTHHAKRRALRAGLRIDTARVCGKDVYATLPVLERAASPDEACRRGLLLPPLRSPSEVAGRKPRRRLRVGPRLPPLKLALGLDAGQDAPYQGPVPGAPRLLPRQLPEEESGVEEMMLGSASFSDEDLLWTPEPADVQVYSGLCIVIPPRGVKRKLQDDDENPQPKRILKARWNESQA